MDMSMSGFDGLACKRIAFNGHINDAAQDCVVSFPGHYSDLWDHAVQAAKVQDRFSLACVFLTDTEPRSSTLLLILLLEHLSSTAR